MNAELKDVGNPILGRKVKGLRDKMGMTQGEFAKLFGKSQAWASKLERGLIDNPRDLRRIAEKCGVNASYLFDDDANTTDGPQVQKAVPIISNVQAGEWESINEFRDMAEEEQPAYATVPVSRSAYALIVQGDSMVSPNGGPSYPPGAVIIVDPLLPEQPGKRVVYRLEPEGAATFKQLESDGFKFWLKPLNPRYEVIPLTESAKYCGTVVQTFINE